MRDHFPAAASKKRLRLFRPVCISRRHMIYCCRQTDKPIYGGTMGLFDLFKKKNENDGRTLPEEDREGTAAPAPETEPDSGDEQPADTAPVPPADADETDEEEGMTFTPGDAFAPSDEDIPEEDEDTLRQIRLLCADRAPLLRGLRNHLTLLDSLRETYPAVSMFAPENTLREDMTQEEANKAFGETIQAVAKAMGAIKYHPALKHFNDVETDDLKNAWVLLDYYAAATAKADPSPFVRGRRILTRTLWGRLEKEDIPFLERTRAVGKTPDGVEYVMQAQEEDWNYLIELHDREGKLPQVGKPAEGQIVLLSFGITKDEFALKDETLEDGSRPKVNEFISLLLDKLPQDRLIAAGIVDNATRRLTPSPIKPKCITMDNRKLVRWRSPIAVERYSGLEKFWVIYSKATGERFPMLDANSCAWVCSAEEHAAAAVKNNAAFDLKAKEMPAAEFRAFVASLAPMGVLSFRVNMGTRDHPCEILCDDYLKTTSSPLGYEGAALNRLTLRFRQNARAKDDPAAQAAASTCWNMIAHVLPGTLFLVPFNYKEDVFVNDSALHVTAASARLLKIKALERSLGRRLKPNEVAELGRTATAAMNIYDRDMFFGGGDCTLADPAQAALGRPMMFSTVKGGGNTFLCGFTDVAALKAVFPMHKRIAVLTWAEMKHHIGNRNSDGSVSSGIVINPRYIELVVNDKQVAELDKAAKEPVKIFLPQQKKA